ncbi:hypothetical protein JRQ81_013498, partial [Phrynocephalus forsythii]
CTGPAPIDCTACESTRFLDDGHCVPQCPNGKFGFQDQCYPCHPTCAECSGSEPTQCTACGKDKKGNMLFLHVGECLETCPLGHYPSEEDRMCKPCMKHCEVCLDQTKCERCFEGYNLADNICKKHECGKGEIQGLDSEECVPCEGGCLTCSLDDPSICTSCLHNYYMYNQQCYRSCPQHTYNDENSLLCIECQPECRSCDKYECYWCKPGFFLLDGKCVRDCGAGLYSDEVTEECELCHRTCRTCTGFNYNDCTSCKGILQLLHGKCVNPKRKQVNGKFWNGTLSPFPLNFTRSLFVFFLFIATATELQPCNLPCKTCDKAPDTCTSCPKGRFLFAESCVHVCPRAMFANVRTRQCENCADGCEECTTANHCLKCLSDSDMPLYLYRSQCLQDCPTGFFAEDGICRACSKSCSTCEGTATRCLSCKSPFLLEQGECKPACSEGHFANDGVCEPCPEWCQECIRGNSCKVCVQPYHLHKGICWDDCPSAFFADAIHCFPCNHNCRECEGPDSDDCTECANVSSVLYNGQCLEECPDGTYYDEETENCEDCDTTCLTCSSSTSCLTCREGYSRTDTGFCMMPQQCSPTEYYDGRTEMCKPCHRKCLACTGPAKDQCLSCEKHRHLLNGTCVEICPDGYYADSDRNQCSACHRSCETCYGKYHTQCISCPPSWYKQENRCVPACTTGYYANNLTATCEACHKSCKECFGPESTACLSCDDYFFLLRSKNECHISCPESHYEDHNKHTCERCHPVCRSCTGKGPFSCTSCVWSYRLAAGICDSECLIGKYKVSENSASCEECHESCMQCKGPGPLNCTACHLNMELYLNENRCVPCCKSSELVQTQECCDCSGMQDECILRIPQMLEKGKGKAATLMVAILILLILTFGAIAFLWRRLRAKPKPVNQGGYEKLADNAKGHSSFKSNHYQSPSYQEDQMIEYKDRDEDDDDDDDDIVYMGQDGTVYRKFKYGLLEEDEIDELEYDDESYSFK